MLEQATTTDPALRLVLDRLEIQELAARYNEASRELDADAYADCFVDEGVYRHVPSGPWGHGLESCGRDELHAMVLNQKQSVGDIPRGMQHVTTDFQIEVDGDSATSKCVMLLYGRFAPGEANRIEACGLYNDKLVRTPGGWRFAERQSVLWHAND
jgi:ketosteroid isomerase-like protein